MHGLALFLYVGVKYSLMKSLSQGVPAPCNPIQYQVDNNLWHLSLSLLSPYFRKDSSYLGVGNQLSLCTKYPHKSTRHSVLKYYSVIINI